MPNSSPDDAIAPEIIWFTPSQRFIRRPEQFLSKTDKLKESGDDTGMVENFHGVQVNNQNHRVWVMVWKSLAHHRDFMGNESYADLVLPVMEAMVGTGKITQILIDNLSEFERALSAPVTQFVYITMRPLHDRGYELQPLLQTMRKYLKKAPGCIAACSGPSVEDDMMQVGVIGWESVEHRDAAIKGQIARILGLIWELSSVETRFANVCKR